MGIVLFLCPKHPDEALYTDGLESVGTWVTQPMPGAHSVNNGYCPKCGKKYFKHECVKQILG